MLSPSCADEGSSSKKPKRVLRGEERNNRADIIGLADPLERLHAENEGLALVGLDEVRHVGVDHARRDRVNADAARPERCREILHQRVDRALRGRMADRVPTAACAPREETRITLLPSPSTGSNCCTRKYGARTLTAKSLSKSSTVISSMVAALETPALATRMSRRSPMMLRASLASLPAPSAAARSTAMASARPPPLRISATTPSASFGPRP